LLDYPSINGEAVAKIALAERAGEPVRVEERLRSDLTLTIFCDLEVKLLTAGNI
jgi:hypothetical protein